MEDSQSKMCFISNHELLSTVYRSVVDHRILEQSIDNVIELVHGGGEISELLVKMDAFVDQVWMLQQIK